MTVQRKPEEIARDVLQCAEAWEPQARLLGNVSAEEIAYLARAVLFGNVALGKRYVRPDFTINEEDG